MEGIGPCLCCQTNHAHNRRDWAKPQRTFVRSAPAQAGVWTWTSPVRIQIATQSTAMSGHNPKRYTLTFPSLLQVRTDEVCNPCRKATQTFTIKSHIPHSVCSDIDATENVSLHIRYLNLFHNILNNTDLSTVVGRLLNVYCVLATQIVTHYGVPHYEWLHFRFQYSWNKENLKYNFFAIFY
jgi:hypothetical protein